MRPWVQPWDAPHAAGEVSRPLRFNAVPYRGINVVLLWLSALRRHFASPLWMTYRQAAELGGQVRRGEKGALVVYADTFTRREADDNGQEQEVAVPFLKSYTVFNSDQIDGLPARYYAQASRPAYPAERLGRAERLFGHTGADIRHGGGVAYYAPAGDFVQTAGLRELPPGRGVLRHPGPRDVPLDQSAGPPQPPVQRAALGRRGLCDGRVGRRAGRRLPVADLGLTPETRADHAAYIASWLKVLRNDKRAVFTAASHAQRTADYLHDLQPKPAEAAA